MSRSLEQRKEHEPVHAVAAEEDELEAEHDPAVSRRASLADLRRQDPVQRRAAGSEVSSEGVHEAAARGVASPATALPHADRIQASFGSGHDVSQIRAHVGGNTASAMGAQAYASGNDVVFDKQPDLHTAAHEAAHVVQQARGVNLYGGVGKAGDTHEQQADAVADRVVAGQSAADLLGPATKGAAPAPTAAVQHKKKDNVEDATKEQREEQHDTAGLRTYWAVKAQVELVASRMFAAAHTVESIVNQTKFDAAGGEREAEILDQTYDDVLAMVQTLLARVQTSAADLPGYAKGTVGADLGVLEGAWFRFSIQAQRADGFLSRHQRPTTAGTRSRSIGQSVEQIYAAFGKSRGDVKRTLSEPEGGPAGAESQAIHQTLDALFQHLRAARMDSQSDLEAGHKQVTMAGHRAKEAHALLRSSSDRKKAKKYKADLTKVSAEADKLADTSPNLYMDMKKFGLLEEIAAMKKGN